MWFSKIFFFIIFYRIIVYYFIFLLILLYIILLYIWLLYCYFCNFLMLFMTASIKHIHDDNFLIPSFSYVLHYISTFWQLTVWNSHKGMIKSIINKVYKQSIKIQFLGIMPALGILKVKRVAWKWIQYYVKQCSISILIIKKKPDLFIISIFWLLCLKSMIILF